MTCGERGNAAEMGHTPELLGFQESLSDCCDFEIFDTAEGNIVAGEYGIKERANARRLVACWNACKGIPTEALEDGTARAERDALREMTGGTFWEIKKQRDELLSASENLIAAIDRGDFLWPIVRVRIAIDRVKGQK